MAPTKPRASTSDFKTADQTWSLPAVESATGRLFLGNNNLLEALGERRAEALAAQPDLLMPPEAVAGAYWALYNQPKSAWTFEQEIRPYGEKW